ncbi:hypothetical protein [Streptomyces sp. L2]|uniref:hypothetical protein n=1 Tax=Streptomyces sp. L2 TaxID=2162665 RepID=UPI0010103EBD|nr:hypothetical protein [Streptomyces sp. L2]
MNNKLRLTAASAVAATVIGLAGTTAQAATQHDTAGRATATTQVIKADNNAQARAIAHNLTSNGVATSAEVKGSSVVAKGVSVGKIITLVKKSKPAWQWLVKNGKKAYQLGKTKGVAYIRREIDNMKWYSPVKWVLKGSGFYSSAATIWEVITWVYHHV